MDFFCTPRKLADKMVQVSRSHAVDPYVADFAVGDGELLRAALRRWPSVHPTATDVDAQIVARLRRANPDWRVGKCDFLDSRSRAKCRVLSEIKGKVSLVLMNPPFSCRGAKRWLVSINGTHVAASKALAFVLASLSYLAPEGEIVTILPAGTLLSDKDKWAWEILRRLCFCESIATNGRATFAGCFPRTVLMRLRLRSDHRCLRRTPTPSGGSDNRPKAATVSIVRGTIQMHTLSGTPLSGSVPLVHTTELRQNRVHFSRWHVDPPKRKIKGPAVLLPRVGHPNPDKICLFLKRQHAALSDCVIALKCKTSFEARSVRDSLVTNWRMLRTQYGGTCAPYITISRLTQVLEQLGFHVTRAPVDRHRET